MVQRDPSPRGDKNGADINLALDALEMAFTHDHINAFAIVSGDSDFIALVNKLKQYDKRIFVVGGRAFTSTILQKNCHEFISYESLLDDEIGPRRRSNSGPSINPAGSRRNNNQQQRRPQTHAASGAARSGAGHAAGGARPGLLERRSVRPQLGLLKSTMLQLDSAFSEKAYGSSSFTDFVEKLQKANYVHVTGGEGRYMIKRIGAAGPEKSTVRPEAALPVLRDVLETHRMEVDEGVAADALAEWVKQEHPDYDWKQYGFQEFSELLNYAQDKLVVRITADEEKGLTVYLGPEFHPPAPPEPPPEPAIEEEVEEPQPIVAGQPTAAGIIPDVEPPPTRGRTTRKSSGPRSTGPRSAGPPKKRAPRRKKTEEGLPQ
jgi:hypothetical protein